MASSGGQSSDPGAWGPEVFEARITRRRLLRSAAATGLALGAGGILAACGGDDDEAAVGTATGGGAEGPTTGGRLRVAHVGAGKGESFNPARGSSFIDASRYFNVYDPLSRVSPDLEVQPGLALEWNPNDDSTTWEVKLRPDVTWHDGKPFTADDVIYTFGEMADPKHVSHASVTNINLREVKKVDDLTLEVPLKSPNARLFDSFVQQNTVIVQDGAKDFTNPVGTGPFVFESFTVGERSLCTKNPNYWEEGEALRRRVGGHLDRRQRRPAERAPRRRGRHDQPDPVRPGEGAAGARRHPGHRGREPRAPGVPDGRRHRAVRRPARRQAFRLIPDRQALIDSALFGYGTIGNDLAGKGMPFYAEDLPPREQDLEQAAALLSQAGQENLKVTLHTSDIVPGFVEAATLFAQQAQGRRRHRRGQARAGKRLLRHVAPLHEARLRPVVLDVLVHPALVRAGTPLRRGLERDALARSRDRQAHPAGPGRPDEATATELWHQIQEIQYEEGGYIVWAYQTSSTARLRTCRESSRASFFNLGGWNYRDVYLT